MQTNGGGEVIRIEDQRCSYTHDCVARTRRHSTAPRCLAGCCGDPNRCGLADRSATRHARRHRHRPGPSDRHFWRNPSAPRLRQPEKKRTKVLMHGGVGLWLAARRPHQGKFVWAPPGIPKWRWATLNSTTRASPFVKQKLSPDPQSGSEFLLSLEPGPPGEYHAVVEDKRCGLAKLHPVILVAC
jgi:hypothetical protein